MDKEKFVRRQENQFIEILKFLATKDMIFSEKLLLKEKLIVLAQVNDEKIEQSENYWDLIKTGLVDES